MRKRKTKNCNFYRNETVRGRNSVNIHFNAKTCVNIDEIYRKVVMKLNMYFYFAIIRVEDEPQKTCAMNSYYHFQLNTYVRDSSKLLAKNFKTSLNAFKKWQCSRSIISILFINSSLYNYKARANSNRNTFAFCEEYSRLRSWSAFFCNDVQKS